jgi:uncharacterized protein YgiM (DUF1202 family)
MRRTFIISWIVFASMLSACKPAPSSPTATVPPPTATNATAPTDTPTLPPTATVTPTAFTPFKVVLPLANNVNLRTGPGYLFPVLKLLPQGTELLLLGRAPGGEWFYVQQTEKLKGWVFGKLLKGNPALQEAPIIEPTKVQLIRGRVLDEKGTPIRGVGFGVVRHSNPSAPGNPVVSDANGEFFSFFPSATTGVWTVTYTSIACESNVWRDVLCSQYKEGYTGTVSPHSIDATLPNPDALQFTWK